MDSVLSTFTQDKLLAGVQHNVTETVKDILLGEGALARGTVLGEITLGAAAAAVNGAGSESANTGNGTLTLDATTPILSGAKPGIYTVKILRVALAQVGTDPVVPAQKALAELRDPDGNVLEVFDVSTTPGNTVSNQIKFVIVEGATPFIITDGFKITIAAGSGKLKKATLAAVDGSNKVYGVLAADVDATSADAEAVVYLTGQFNEDALVFGTGLTKTNTKVDARSKGIHYTEVFNNSPV